MAKASIMGFFDMFKKNSRTQLSERTDLEMLLLQHKSNGIDSPELYSRLLNSDLIIITHNTDSIEGKHNLHQQSSVNIVTFPEGQIPVFSSVDRIYDKGVIREQVQYIQMKGSDLFNMATGATFIVNPYSDTCKEFLPQEVTVILSHASSKNGIYMEKASDIQIGLPPEYPREMIKRLSDFFSTRKEVLSAYLGWIFNPGVNKIPHYIIGIKANEESGTLVKTACDIAMEALPPKMPVDIVVLNRRSKISDYLVHQTKPFYQRSVQLN